MQTKQELAVELSNRGFNCAQSVLGVFCEKYCVNKETALKMASGLGSGFRSGEICGAVSGAILVIGLKYGQFIAEDKSSKLYCNAKTVEFLNIFKMKNRSCLCREILGCNVSTIEGQKQAQEKNLFKTVCVDMVKSAVAILEELGY